MFWGYHENFGEDYNGEIYSIIDTGSTSLMISSIYFESYIAKIFEQVPEVVDWLYRNDYIYT